MDQGHATAAKLIAQAAVEAEQQRTGHAPSSAAVVLSEDVLVVALHGALSPAEMAVAQSPTGSAPLQELHRALFAVAADTLREKIRSITGIPVRAAASQIDSADGTVVTAFSTGTVVQVFLLSGKAGLDAWSGSVAAK